MSEVRKATTTSLDKVRATIRATLLQQKRNEEMQAWVEDLKKDYEGKVSYAAGYEPPQLPEATHRDPVASRSMSLAEALLDLQELTRRLRRECPWDREQTAVTIVPHTVEEAYEVADAALADDAQALHGELGDLLFQVYFLSLLLEERGEGDLESVARDVHAKLVRRHPHVFGDADARTPGRVRERWEALKTEQEGREGIFHDVPDALPALLQARKVQRRAAAVGYDWPDLAGPLAKVQRGAGGARGGEHSRGRAGARDRARPARSSTSSATCSSRSSTSPAA